MILSMKDKTINWEQLQENYMKECVTKVGQFKVWLCYLLINYLNGLRQK